MTIKTAQKLLREPIENMGLLQVQRHKVRLLDAWRESRAEYGIMQAIKDGFYKAVNSGGTGYAPADIFLTTNLSYKYEEAAKHENKILLMEAI